MILPPRSLFIRLVFWIAVFGWAVWKMQSLGTTAVTGVSLLDTPAVRIVLEPAVAPVAPTDPAPAVVDPVAALAAMDAALTASGSCHMRGTLQVVLGPAGLASAVVEGAEVPGDADVRTATTCVTAAVWGAAWPRTQQAFEMARPLP